MNTKENRELADYIATKSSCRLWKLMKEEQDEN
jgi:hypothetical protein